MKKFFLCIALIVCISAIILSACCMKDPKAQPVPEKTITGKILSYGELFSQSFGSLSIVLQSDGEITCYSRFMVNHRQYTMALANIRLAKEQNETIAVTGTADKDNPSQFMIHTIKFKNQFEVKVW
jgi:hypothetical protein